MTGVDTYTHEAPIIEVTPPLTGQKVVGARDRVAKRTAYPKMLTVDNGTEVPPKPARRGRRSMAANWISCGLEDP